MRGNYSLECCGELLVAIGAYGEQGLFVKQLDGAAIAVMTTRREMEVTT